MGGNKKGASQREENVREIDMKKRKDTTDEESR